MYFIYEFTSSSKLDFKHLQAYKLDSILNKL